MEKKKKTERCQETSLLPEQMLMEGAQADNRDSAEEADEKGAKGKKAPSPALEQSKNQSYNQGKHVTGHRRKLEPRLCRAQILS